MTIPLGASLPIRSSCQPGPLGLKHPCGDIPERISPHEAPTWHCSRWGLPCRFGCPSRGALLPHRFTLTPETRGGLFSVALSVGFPRPGVTRHRCFRESGLSSKVALRGHPAIRARQLSSCLTCLGQRCQGAPAPPPQRDLYRPTAPWPTDETATAPR